MDSGVAAISLPPTQIAYGTNTTVRGQYITHRPPYNQQKLILDAGLSIASLRFQGATYYDPDFGAESIVAQIGGRLLQFIPDDIGNAYVYDRSARVYVNGAGFTTQPSGQNLQYSLVLQNVTGTAGNAYAAGTLITSDPSFISTTAADLTMNPSCGSSSCSWKGNLLLPENFTGASSLDGDKVFIGPAGGINNRQWSVLGDGISGSNPYITIGLTLGGNFGNPISFPSGSLVLLTTNPTPPNTLATASSGFSAPAQGSNVTVLTSAQYPGSVGDYILISSSIYQVISIPTPSNSGSSIVVPNAPNTSDQFTYDLNPDGIPQAWLWQSENYVIVNDGESRPLEFDGVSTKRSTTPTFKGKVTESFVIPQIGQSVNLSLDSDFEDAAGTFIQISPLDLYPFLMEVIAVNVGGDPTVITAANITGQSATGSIVSILAPVQSVTTPEYVGVLTSNFTGGQMTAPGSVVSLSVSPAFNGVVGDSIFLTDGTGPLTEYEFTVTAITAGGNGITATNVSAPTNLLLAAGYPIVSQNQVPAGLPPGRMGAYVEGRNWISSVDGKSFFASDQVGDSSGIQALNFRDAVLKWSLNTTKFSIPGGAGEITCITPLSSLDASLGQGPLQILCTNSIFTCAAPTDATQWPSVTSPILFESAIGWGGVGQNGAAIVNSDLITRSTDGSIHSLKLSRQDFDKWGSLPISKEMNRVISEEDDDLLQFVTAEEVDNRCLSSCAPITVGGSTFSQGMIALDFDVTSGLQGKLPSVYDGVWKDLNLLQIVSGEFSGKDRTFAFCLDTSSNVILVELLSEGSFDNGNTSIIWSFESPVLHKAPGKFSPKRLEDGEIYISNLVGRATITAWYRPDFDQCWHVWNSFSVCADNITAGAAQYRTRLGLGKPQDDECDFTVNKKPRDGRFFQLRFEIEGSLTFMACVSMASQQPQPLFPPIPVPEGVGQSLQQSTPSSTMPTPPCKVYQSKLVYYSNPPVVYQSDPNVEGLKPADPTKSCVAYSQNGDGSFYGWNISSQLWE